MSWRRHREWYPRLAGGEYYRKWNGELYMEVDQGSIGYLEVDWGSIGNGIWRQVGRAIGSDYPEEEYGVVSGSRPGQHKERCLEGG
jgi:hypothetical protein